MWKRHYAEVSHTMGRLMVVLIGYSFFCLLALGQPDVSLLDADATIKLPFAAVEISFVSFLVIGPLVLIGILFYLHIFIGYWVALQYVGRVAGYSPESAGPPFIFNLHGRTSSWLSTAIFYWLGPVVLAVFTWKALPRSEAPALVFITGGVTLTLLWLQIRRCSDDRRRQRNLVHWSLISVLLVLSLSWAVYFLWWWGESNYEMAWKHAIVEPLRRPLNLYKAPLNDKDLRRLNMAGAILTEAKLANANLEGAYLRDADLRNANLAGANLKDADLARADLSGAILSGATLQGSILIDTDFVGANLSQTNLTGAVIDGANLAKSNLTGSSAKPEDIETAWSLSGAELDRSVQEALERSKPTLFAYPDPRLRQPKRSDTDIVVIMLDRAMRAMRAVGALLR